MVFGRYQARARNSALQGKAPCSTWFFFLWVVLRSTYTAWAAAGFARSEGISSTLDGARAVFAADVDGDGDLDVLAAGEFDGVAWFENTDGLGDFDGGRFISSDLSGAQSVSAADLDGDGDMDVLVTSYYSGQDGVVAWYENTDGLGEVWRRIIIFSPLSQPWWVTAADVDGDGDMDVLVASAGIDDSISWYRNIDGAGNFEFALDLSGTTGDDGANMVITADMDDDGDLDVLSASSEDHRIAWYENTDGLGTFSRRNISESAEGATYVFAADLDGDGDLDVISVSHDDDRVVWYENTDGAGTFSTTGGNEIDVLGSAQSVIAADLDDDGDMDLVCSSYNDGRIVLYENSDGLGSFSSQSAVDVDIDVGVKEVIAADLDGDGDLDLISANIGYDRVVWYENLAKPATTPAPTTTASSSSPTEVPTSAYAEPTGAPGTATSPSSPPVDVTDTPVTVRSAPTSPPASSTSGSSGGGKEWFDVAWEITVAVVAPVIAGVVLWAITQNVRCNPSNVS